MLPNAHQAVIAPEKLTDYLLNLEHSRGGPKARFFLAFGFRVEAPEELGMALLAQDRAHPASMRPRRNGVAYVVEGPIGTPSGRRPWVRTVWTVDEDAASPRLITAYPLDERDDDEKFDRGA